MSILQKLSEEALARPPEEVFDMICKLGEGSYGSVYKALHKETGHVLAIKQVPVESDLAEIIKEISIMQQCDSPYIVRYYGSYFQGNDLWIVMEYCGGGSVSDIMRYRKKTLNEDEISTILKDTLLGLEYLHTRRKIHRDIKAGNILLNHEGHAKLADFGVAGQMTDTMAKRNTVIGTPFWMAPEVILEVGYDCLADIWSLGITALELAEGKPPYGDIHPMRAIFMIPNKPPPSFHDPDRWSSEFIDFVSKCLVKNPEQRASAGELLRHEFIQRAMPVEHLQPIIEEAKEIRLQNAASSTLAGGDDSDDAANKTMVPNNGQDTLKPSFDDNSNRIYINVNTRHSATFKQSNTMSDVASDLGTLIINDESDDEDGYKTLKPSFMQHFDLAATRQMDNRGESSRDQYTYSDNETDESTMVIFDTAKLNRMQQQQQKQIELNQQQIQQQISPSISHHVLYPPISREILMNGNLDYLRFFSLAELRKQKANLDFEMENEIQKIARRYDAKRQPIQESIEKKRKSQQNF